MKLPLASSCGGCSRREVLTGIGVAAATLIAGCGTSEQPGVDGSSGPDANLNTGVSMCGAMVCVDLNNPATNALSQVNGQLVVIAPSTGKHLILVRTSETQIAVLSDVCTHAGCFVHYDTGLMQLRCPCHGSRFSLTGSVIQGPAELPLKVFSAQLDSETNMLSITLA